MSDAYSSNDENEAPIISPEEQAVADKMAAQLVSQQLSARGVRVEGPPVNVSSNTPRIPVRRGIRAPPPSPVQSPQSEGEVDHQALIIGVAMIGIGLLCIYGLYRLSASSKLSKPGVNGATSIGDDLGGNA